MKLVMLLIVSFAVAPNVYGNCSRSDITFYLEKGFSHQQTVDLCSSAHASEEKTATGKSSAETTSSELDYLITNIEASDVEITESHLSYTQSVCFRNGQSPERNQRINDCRNALVKISLDGVTTKVHQSPVPFVGRDRVWVTSGEVDITLGTSLDFSHSTPLNQAALEKKYNRFRTSLPSIPLRQGADAYRFSGAIMKLAKQASTVSDQTPTPDVSVPKTHASKSQPKRDPVMVSQSIPVRPYSAN